MFDLIKAVFGSGKDSKLQQVDQTEQSVVHWRTLYFEMAAQYDELEEQADLYKQRMYAQTNKLKAERKKTGRLLYLLDVLVHHWNQEEHPSSADMYLCMVNLIDALDRFENSKRFLPEPVNYVDTDDNCGTISCTISDID